MSSDVEVYVRSKIIGRGAPINLLKGIGGVRAQGEEIKNPPPSAKGINNLMCAAEPKARQSLKGHNLSVSHRPYTTMRRDDRRRVA